MLRLKVLVFWILVGCFAYPSVARAQELIIQLNDDFARINPGGKSSIDIMKNDIIQNLPQLGWIFEITQPANQHAKFGFLFGNLSLADAEPGYYFFTYSLSLGSISDEAKVIIIVLNWDGSDPPQPRSPISPLYIPILRGK